MSLYHVFLLASLFLASKYIIKRQSLKQYGTNVKTDVKTNGMESPEINPQFVSSFSTRVPRTHNGNRMDGLFNKSRGKMEYLHAEE